MTRRLLVVFAWYFLVQGGYGGYSGSSTFTQAGPFKEEHVCKTFALWAKKNGATGTIVSDCWEANSGT